MSLIGVQNAVLSAASGVIPGSVTHVGGVQHGDIPAGSFPYLYTTAWEISQQVDGQNVRTGKTYAGALVIVTISDYADLVAFAEAALTAIESDSTLLGLVDDVLVGLSTDARANVEDVEQRSAILPIEATVQAVGSSVLIKWTVVTQIVLRDTGTTLTAYLDAMAAALVTTLSGTRLSNDIGDPLESIAQGTTRFQLSHVAAKPYSAESNADHRLVTMQLVVWRHQASGATERAYTEGSFDTETVAVLDPDYWKAGLSTVDVIEEPTLEFPSDLERV